MWVFKGTVLRVSRRLQSTQIQSILVVLLSSVIITSLVFFYLGNLLLSGFQQFKGHMT